MIKLIRIQKKILVRNSFIITGIIKTCLETPDISMYGTSFKNHYDTCQYIFKACLQLNTSSEHLLEEKLTSVLACE